MTTRNINAPPRQRRVRRPTNVRFLTTVNTVCGHFAMWAVRQSPYGYPDKLDVVLRKLRKRLEDRARATARSELMRHAAMFRTTRRKLEELLTGTLDAMPAYRAWNKRKNGNKAPLHFTSRYSVFEKPNPDDDFIDLYALVANVVNSVAREEIRDPADAQQEWPDDTVARTEGR